MRGFRDFCERTRSRTADHELVVRIEEIAGQVVRDDAEFAARDPELLAVVVGERRARDRDRVASCHEERDGVFSFLEDVSVAVVDGDVFHDEDVVDLVDDREPVFLLRGQDDVAEPPDVAEGACALQTEGRKDREDGLVVEEQAHVAEDRVVMDLGQQLRGEKDAVVGTSADVDVRGAEEIGLLRVQLDRSLFRLRLFRLRGDGQFRRDELNHGELGKRLSEPAGSGPGRMAKTNIT